MTHSHAEPAAAEPAATGRARPLPPDERRAALIEAVLPLVSEYGTRVTTRQLAQAAGVAEGTIFRVFPDKESLIKAAVEAVFDPVAIIAELDGIDLDLPLRQRLTTLVAALQRRLTRVINLMTAVGMHRPPEDSKDLKKHREQAQATNERLLAAVCRVLEPDRDEFSCPVPQVAHILRLLTFAGSHHMINDNNPLDADQIVSVLLDGVLKQPNPGGNEC